MKLMEKLKKSGSIKTADILSESSFFIAKDIIQTNVPALNIALSGSLSGGLTPGLTIIAGPSRHFKSMFGLVMVKSYLDKYKDSVCLFLDSEFGITPQYIESMGIDTSRVLHIPIEHIEQLKFDISKRLEEIGRGDKVIIFIDSIGNLASKKEVEDALEEKSAADMTRAKQLKSLFRIMTPHFTTKDIPCVVVNHSYMEQCLEGSTLIKTSEGFKPIRDIVVGDQVYAITGLQNVLAVYGPNQIDGVGKRYLELTFDDGSIIKCTHDHKFLMKNNEWKLAEDIKIGEIFYCEMRKLIGVKEVKKFDLYDITVEKDHAFELSNGVIAHNSLYPKAIMSGGTGPMYSANTVFMIGKQQEKDGTEIIGYNFIINVEKSRYVKEKSKIPISVSFDGGISKWSGLLDIALESGHVIKPSNGWYSKVDVGTGEVEDKKYRLKDIDTKEFWMSIVTSKSFSDFIHKKYQVAYGAIIKDEDIERDLEKAIEEA